MHLGEKRIEERVGVPWPPAPASITRSCAILLASVFIVSQPFTRADPVAAAPATLTPPTQSAKWEEDIAAFEASDRTHPPQKGGIVFIGSSSIRMWESLAKDFAGKNVINRGFGGSQIADSVAFAERIVWPYEPRLVVLYAGGNDLNAGKSPEDVFADYRAFVAKVHERLPETEIAFISVAGNPARWAQVERVKALNAMVERFAREDSRLKFINVFPHMLGSDGLPRPEIFSADRLHMNAEGYKLWAEIVRPFLDDR